MVPNGSVSCLIIRVLLDSGCLLKRAQSRKHKPQAPRNEPKLRFGSHGHGSQRSRPILDETSQACEGQKS